VKQICGSDMKIHRQQLFTRRVNDHEGEVSM
jgi:hypothetical protein